MKSPFLSTRQCFFHKYNFFPEGTLNFVLSWGHRHPWRVSRGVVHPPLQPLVTPLARGRKNNGDCDRGTERCKQWGWQETLPHLLPGLGLPFLILPVGNTDRVTGRVPISPSPLPLLPLEFAGTGAVENLHLRRPTASLPPRLWSGDGTGSASISSASLVSMQALGLLHSLRNTLQHDTTQELGKKCLPSLLTHCLAGLPSGLPRALGRGCDRAGGNHRYGPQQSSPQQRAEGTHCHRRHRHGNTGAFSVVGNLFLQTVRSC